MNKLLNADFFRKAMDSRLMGRKLGSIMVPGGQHTFQLNTRRAFPWSMGGKGAIEYEVNLGNHEKGITKTRIINARMCPDKGKDSKNPIACDSIPMTPGELDRFFSGLRTISLRDPRMILSSFPHDSRMTWLKDLVDQRIMGDLLKLKLTKFYGRKNISLSEDLALLGHRHGKRCTLQYSLAVSGSRRRSSDRIRIIGKTFCDGRGRLTFEILQQLWDWSSSGSKSRPPLIPKPLFYVPEYNIYFQEAKKGFNLAQMKVGELRREMAAGLAELLARFHSSRIIVEGQYTPDDELLLLGKMRNYLPIIRPDLDEMSRDLLTSIHEAADSLGMREFTPGITHRDFYDKQAIVCQEGIYLVDLDTVTMSDQAMDVGNFLAHIFLRALQYGEPEDETTHNAHYFISAYRSHNPWIDDRRITFYLSTSLFRLACLYAYRPTWSRLIGRLFGECRKQIIQSLHVGSGLSKNRRV